MNSINPYEPPQTKLEVSEPPIKIHRSLWLRILIMLEGIVTVLGSILALYEVRSITLSGMIASAIGGIIAVLGMYRQSIAVACYGISAPFFAAFIILLIRSMRLNPSSAVPLIPALIVAYALFALPTALWLLNAMGKKV